jgi:tetratricopeptide (TPR) repeat protein
LPEVQQSDVAHAHALFAEAALASDESDHAEAGDMLEICLTLRRRLGNPLEIAATLSTLSLARLQAGDAERAGECEREALDIFRSEGEKLGEAIGLLHLGQIAVYSGDHTLAQSSLLECLRIAEAIENREVEGEAHLRLGEADFERGHLDEARVHLHRSLEVCRQAGDRRGEVHALWWLGRADLEAGLLDQARTRFGDALRTFQDFVMREEMADCLEDHAVLASRGGQVSTAVRIAAATFEYRRRLDLVLSPYGQRRWDARMQSLRSGLPETEFTRMWDEGRDADLGEVIRVAQSLAAVPVATHPTGSDGPAPSDV